MSSIEVSNIAEHLETELAASGLTPTRQIILTNAQSALTAIRSGTSRTLNTDQLDALQSELNALSGRVSRDQREQLQKSIRTIRPSISNAEINQRLAVLEASVATTTTERLTDNVVTNTVTGVAGSTIEGTGEIMSAAGNTLARGSTGEKIAAGALTVAGIAGLTTFAKWAFWNTPKDAEGNPQKLGIWGRTKRIGAFLLGFPLAIWGARTALNTLGYNPSSREGA